MTRWITTLAVALAAVSTSLHADVTVKTTMTMEGAAAAAMAQQGAAMPTMTMRIKGQKMRNDIEGPAAMTTITDLAGPKMFMVNHAQKTVQVVDGKQQIEAPAVLPKMDATVKATGQTRTIDGVTCHEHTFRVVLDMASAMGGGRGQMPPEAAEMLKGVSMVMSGSMWISKEGPAAAEFMAFQKAAAAADLTKIVGGSLPGMSGGLDTLMAMSKDLEGINYLTEMTMTVEGSGQMVEMMKQMGGADMKMTMRVSSVSTETVPADMFVPPADYKVITK